MAKGTNQKLKVIYLMKILLEKTDEEHSITMNEIIDSLSPMESAQKERVYTAISRVCANMEWIL